jgi:hypothetical protein
MLGKLMGTNTGLKNDEIESVQPTLITDYQLFSPHKNRVIEQPDFNQAVRHKVNDVEIDSDLKLIGKRHRLKSSIVNKPENKNLEASPNTMKLPSSDGTRQRRSCNTLSGVTIDRYEYPLRNPQLNGIQQNRGMQSRLAAKDEYAREHAKLLRMKK